MARPTDKQSLLKAATECYEKLMELVSRYSESELTKEFPEGTLNRNIRDVLAHLFHWHLLFQNWYETGMQGKKPDIPAKGYTWKTTPDLNAEIREMYKNTPPSEVLKKLARSHEYILSLIHTHSNEELFNKQHYHWTGTTSLGAYFISATSAHYNWAIKLIKKQSAN